MPFRFNLAHTLTGLRLVLTPVFVLLLEFGAHSSRLQGMAVSILVFALICMSDYFDGPVARRLGRDSEQGKVFDNLADITFLLTTLTYLAHQGVVPFWIPLTVALAFSQYTVDSCFLSRKRASLTLISNPIGHWAGILNYTLTGVFSLNWITQGRLLPEPLPFLLALFWLFYLLAAMSARLHFFLLHLRQTPIALRK